MKTYNSKEEFEAKNPYVLVTFETYDNKTVATIEKSFTNRKSAQRYYEERGHNKQEIMTRKQYMKNALMCM